MAAIGVADVLLAECRSGVPGIGEQLAERVLPRCESVLALPGSGTLRLPVRIGKRPLRIAERIGVHCASTL